MHLQNEKQQKSVNQHTRIIVPDVIMNFGCIMGACEDNCCHNTTWSISIDSNSYMKYKELGGEVGQRILDCIDDSGPVFKMKQFEDGKCPLMTEGGLCYIHKELGLEYLSETCKNYPRMYAFFSGHAEHWLSLSCPEVVRQVLYSKKGISFLENKIAGHSPPQLKPLDEEKAMARRLLMNIVAYRELTIREKLLYMGMFMRSIGKLDMNMKDHPQGFMQTVQNFLLGLSDARNSLREVTNKLETGKSEARHNILISLATLAAQTVAQTATHPTGIKNELYYKLMESFRQDMADGSTEQIVGTYDSLIVPYVNQKPHVFENYLMYSLMSTMFMSETNNFAEAYSGFAGEFVTMLTFTCLFKDYKTLGDEEIVTAIYLFHRRVSHNQFLRRQLAMMFQDSLLVFLVTALGGIK